MFSMLSSMINGEYENNVAEIIPGRLDLMCFQGASPPSSPATKDAVFFTVDRILNYEPFFADFGPLNLGQLYRFCQIIEEKLQNPEYKGKKLILYTAKGPHKKANTGYLIASYLVIVMNMSPEEAWNKIAHISQGFIPFRDASMQVCTYKLTILNCLKALATATRLGWFNIATFDIQQYEHLEKIENGDLNLIIPGKFVHFSGPSNAHRDPDGYPSKTPNDYIETFKKLGVSDIIRLNKKCYDKCKFTKHGFQHHDMYFIDGTTPSMAILERFMSVCEQAKGMVAVHCKAGLGRTGTCVACYMMKFYRLTAAEAIAWLRICRPGSVLGPQQEFLEDMQSVMWRENDKLRRSASIVSDKKNLTAYNLEKQLQNVKVSSDAAELKDSKKAEELESQGDSLVHRKFEAQHRKSDAEIKFSSDLDFSDLPRPNLHTIE